MDCGDSKPGGLEIASELYQLVPKVDSAAERRSEEYLVLTAPVLENSDTVRMYQSKKVKKGRKSEGKDCNSQSAMIAMI